MGRPPPPRYTLRSPTSGRTVVDCPLESAPCRAPGCPVRESYLRPFCLHHARARLGLDVRRSPLHGYGLFAERDFAAGDAVVLYHGRRHRRLTDETFPYAVRLSGRGGGVIDAACRRGIAAYANCPTGRGRTGNVHMIQAAVSPAAAARMLTGADTDGWVAPVRHSPLWRHGVRRLPVALLELIRGEDDDDDDRSPLWFVARRPIRRGEEILVSYGPHRRAIVAADHGTTPASFPHSLSHG
jgi:hypothetical protein